jgi:transcriptional regulator with XRE-family HTH domain
LISDLIKQIMKHFELEQTDLSEKLGVSLSRVKRLSSGRAEKFSPEEYERLIGMGISAHWLGTGVGPMLQNEREKEFNRRLDAVKTTTQLMAGIDIPEDKRVLIRDILYAAEIGDLEMIKESLASYESVRPDQKALLDNLDHCSKEDQDAIKRMALLAAKADKKDGTNG